VGGSQMQLPVTQPQSVAQPVAAPAVPTPMAPVTKPLGQPIMDDTGRVVGYETPQQMLNNMVSGAPVGANAPTPVTPAAPVAPAQMQTVPGAPVANAPALQTAATANAVPEGGYASTLGSVQAQPHVEKFVNDQMNPASMAALAYDKTAPLEVQRAAAAQHLKQLQNEKGFKDAERYVAENAGNTSDFARMLTKEKGEGSYIKAYIFQRLGLNKLAEQEQQKLGAGNQWMPSVDSEGNRALLEFDANGLAIRGFNGEGRELNKKELAAFAAQAAPLKGSQVHTTMLRDRNTGEIYYQRTLPNGTTQLIDNKNRPFAGKTSDLMVYGVGTELTAAAVKKYNDETAAFNAKNANEYFRPYQWSDGTYRTAPEGNSDAKIVSPGNMDWKTYKQITGNPAAGTEIPKPVAPAPINPQQKMSLPAENQMGGMMNAVYQPEQNMTTTGYNPAQEAGQFIKTAEAPSQAQIEKNREVGKSIAEKAGTQPIESAGAGTTVTAKSRAQRTEALPAREDDARRVLRTIDEVINHPGFEISTGMSAPIGSLMSIVPGTSLGTYARDWQAKYKELQGQNFLEAYQNLRGTGAISEKEGSKAQQAIAALSDPGISESEFKRNAELLKNDVRRRIDTERKSLGMKPLDWGQIEKDMKKETMSQRDRDALDWAERNPRDPRADKIRKELGM